MRCSEYGEEIAEEDVEKTLVYVHEEKCYESLMKGRREERKKKKGRRKSCEEIT